MPLILALLILVLGCQAPPNEPVESVALGQQFEQFYEEYVRYHPFKRTWQGDFRFNDSIENSLTTAYFDQYGQFLNRQLEAFNALEPSHYSPQDILEDKMKPWVAETKDKRP